MPQEVPLTHRLRRTLILVDEITEDQVHVYIPQWDPHVRIDLPARLIPEAIRARLRPVQFLVARVNTDAERAEDLVFEDFEPPSNIYP